MVYRVLSKPNCPYCVRAKQKLTIIGADFTVEEHSTEAQWEAFRLAGHRSYPRIYEGDVLIGGFDDLLRHLDAQDTF